MFGNKKNTLPPRPPLPNHEHMLEDLDGAGMDDVAFRLINESSIKESYGSTNADSSDDIYKKVKTYLNTKQQLRQLESSLKKEVQQMQVHSEEMTKLADDIRKQTQAALGKQEC
ncbi:UPF0449 protein C19orf25 homolog [Pseudomyrmex gracilis]|uniref:UPF0449 protein C19orf25 homolog n=1 Tax=Pseudomyrmex gracilis TaxID=219809 RepID=UPI000995C49D|nr:UPF0449 protein C19orf25 homolog [Pseudomyrmex gracilis]